jgi:hypothetical protein
MRFIKFKILVFISLFIPILFFGQNYDFVKILSGQGIVYNNDTIFLYKTTIEELHKILKISLPLPNYMTVNWSGSDTQTGEEVSGQETMTKIEFKTMIFEFAGEYEYNLKLRKIEIKEDNKLIVYSDNGLVMGMINPNINEIFPDLGKNDDYWTRAGINYNLNEYGISFELKKINNDDLKIVAMSVHKKF